MVLGANIFTIPLTIRPGVLFDAAADLQFRFGEFGVTTKYAITAKSSEAAGIQSWEDGVYGLSTFAYDSNAAAYALLGDVDDASTLGTVEFLN